MLSTNMLFRQLRIRHRWVEALLFSFALSAMFVSSTGFAQGTGRKASPAEWETIEAAARQEGKVILYTSMVPSILTRMKADFENARPGINLEISRYVSSLVTSKVELERQTGADGADIVTFAEPFWVSQRAKEGQLLAPVGPASTNWPAKHMLGGAAPVLAIEPIVLAYNTKLFTSPITGYQDLLRPEFKDKIGATDPAAAQVVVAYFDWLEKTQGTRFWAEFLAQNVRFYPSVVPATQSAASGEIGLTALSFVTVAQPLIKLGAPLKIVVPKPAFSILWAGGALRWARRPNAALVLIDYLMSARGQTMWSGQGETASPLTGIPGSLDATSLQPFDPGRYPPEVVKVYMDKWNKNSSSK